MAVSLLHSAILSAIQGMVNNLLALDSRTSARLSPLSGKVLQIHCLTPDILVNLIVCENSLQFCQGDIDNPDTIITGTATALVNLLVTRDTSNLKHKGIEIRGSTSLLTSLQEVLMSLNIDWEYHLSKLVGDIPTQALGELLENSQEYAARAGRNLQQDIDDYLHEERQLLPTASQVKSFEDSVDNLRLRVDRLRARVFRLETPTT